MLISKAVKWGEQIKTLLFLRLAVKNIMIQSNYYLIVGKTKAHEDDLLQVNQ